MDPRSTCTYIHVNNNLKISSCYSCAYFTLKFKFKDLPYD